MNRRMIGGVLLLCATACLVSWGQDRTDTQPEVPTSAANVGAAGEVQAKPEAARQGGVRADGPQAKSVGVAKDLTDHERAKPPRLRHITKAQDQATERDIRTQSAALIAEFNAKNANAFVGRFLPNAEYELNTGEVFVGHDAIHEYFSSSFAEFPNAQAKIKESKIRLISLHTAIEEGAYSISQSAEAAPFDSHYIAIWTSSEGHWLLAAVRDLDGADVPATAHEQLNSLGWLVGDWVDESPNELVKTSCRWSEDGNFLLQDYTVHAQGSNVLSGTQRIGWDPLTRKVRSWGFDSQGGYGESFWNWDGERWVIRSSAVHSDGTTVASLNYLIPESNDVYRWEASHRMSGDEALPDLHLKIVRHAPPPETPVIGEPKQ